MDDYRVIIGLEIHAQLATKTKIFCSCSADVFDEPPNSHICPVCTGQPGVLPILNEKVVEFAVKAALALNCRINRYSRFDRKNYFYPDLPKGYQISQYFHPIANDGYLDIKVDGRKKRIRIRRIHVEEDTGKMLHSSETITQAEYSLIDFNRCGVPLIEIVTEPDIESPFEARIFMEKLRDILRYTGVSTGDMEKGALRCDANISVLNLRTGESSPRVEVKNMNSFKFVEKALEYEYKRLVNAMERGLRIERETRGWDFTTKTTVSMRGKEEESDYRYFPEPDLPPLILTDDYVERIREELPELPDEKVERFMREYKLGEYEAEVLSSSRELADYFEECVKIYHEPKKVANLILNDLLGLLNERNMEVNENPVSASDLARIVELVDKGDISSNAGKKVLVEVFNGNGKPDEIVEREGLKKIGDEDFVRKIAREVIETNPKPVNDYKKGKKGAIGFLVGQVMKRTKGRADPKLVNKILAEELEKE